MRAIIETRTQSTGGAARLSGKPDAYVAVQLVPEGVNPLIVLREDSARKRGIKIIRCGDYYTKSTGPRSNYAKAMADAQRIVEKHEQKEENR